MSSRYEAWTDGCWRKRVDRLEPCRIRSTCQKVQPLHDGAPCSAAPTLWIEPHGRSHATEPSARDLGLPAPLGIGQHRARRDQPAFDQQAEGDARRACACRPSPLIALSSSGRVAVDPLAGDARYSLVSRSIPIQCRPSRRATAPVVPVPKNGSSTTSPGLVQASRIAVEQGLGLLRRMRLVAVVVLDPLGARRRSAAPSRSASADRR